MRSESAARRRQARIRGRPARGAPRASLPPAHEAAHVRDVSGGGGPDAGKEINADSPEINVGVEGAKPMQVVHRLLGERRAASRFADIGAHKADY